MSQLRKYLKFTWKHKLRALWVSRRLGFLGKKVYIDKHVEFMRFPGNIFLADDTVVKEGSKISSCKEDAVIKIGKRTTIGYNTFIFASENIVIGDDCLIAPFVYIVDSDHQIRKSDKINKQPNITSSIQIGNDVWIASNVTILKGTTIGNGAVIAANSIVNKDIPPFEIWGGSPAKKIGERK